MIIKLAQCVCPQRHCILALMAVGEDAAIEQSLRTQLADSRKNKGLRGWCALCGAKEETWIVEVYVMKAENPSQALLELMDLAEQQKQTRDHLMVTGQAYDSPRRN